MPDFPAPPMSFPAPVPPPPQPPSLLAASLPSSGWHEPTASAPSPVMPPPPPPPAPMVEAGAEPAKKSFSAAELDHVPRYIAPDEDRPQASPAVSELRAVTGDWQPNELASFSGAEWVPPAVAEDQARAYIAPKAASNEPRRSPRNLIIAVLGVALVAGLGFGVSKALAPDASKIVVETTTATTAAKSRATTPVPPTTVATRPGAPAPGLIGVAKATGAKSEAAVESALETSAGSTEPAAGEAPAP